jgi:hypothetical protein
MSFTRTEHAFGEIHEQGINDLFAAFFGARPRHLNYGTPSFIPTTTAAGTSIAAVAFPGVPGGIEFAVSFGIPTVDVHPDSSGGSSPLVPGPGQLAISTRVILALLCRDGRRTNQVSHGATALSAGFGVFGLCTPVVISPAPGTGEIGIRLDRIKIVDIKPDALESIIECLIRMILKAALANVRLPFNTLTAGAFGLALLVGPTAEDDQIKVRGNVL